MKISEPKSKQPIPDSAKKVFSGILFDVYQWEQEMFDGSFKTFEKLKRKSVVNIIPITKDNKIIIAEQEQPGITNKFQSLIRGQVDRGENILETAKRELLEETGYKSNKFQFWFACQPLEKVDIATYYFIAYDCFQVADQTLDNGEKIKLKTVSLEDFLEIVFSGEFRNKELIFKFLKEKKLKINFDFKELNKIFFKN